MNNENQNNPINNDGGATPPVLPSPTLDVDARIMAENIRQRQYAESLTGAQQSPAEQLLSFISANKVLVVITTVIIFGSIAGVSALMRGPSAPPLKETTIASTNEPTVLKKNFETTPANNSENAPVTGSTTNSGSSDQTAGGTNDPVPGAPGSLSIKAQATMLSVNWKAIPYATQYRLEITSSKDFNSPRAITSGTNSVIVTGLRANTDYRLRVQAIGVKGAGPWSPIATARTQKLPSNPIPLPGKVTGLKATTNSSQSITLSWSGANGASYYSVTRAENSSFTSGKKEYAATKGTGYTMSDLRAGTTYYFFVTASNSSGNGSRSDTISKKTFIVTPSIRSVSVLSTTSLRVSWTRPAGVSKYTVRYSTNSNFSGAKSASTSSDTLTVSGLKGGTTYYLQVRATDGSYTTGWSKAVSARTGIAIPGNFRVTSSSTGSIKASWNTSTGATLYNVRYSTQSSMTNSSGATTKNTSHTFNSLKSGTKYFMQIRAYDGRAWTGWSGKISGTTQANKLNIATYNILGSNHAPKTWERRAKQATTAMKNADVDVFGVQEMQPDQFRRFSELLPGYDKFPKDWGAKRDAGKRTIFWRKDRFSAVSNGHIMFPSYGDNNLYAGHSLPWVKLKEKSSGQTFILISTHAVAWNKDPGSDKDGAQKRERTANLTMNFVDKQSSSTRVFVVGDFNSDLILRDKDGAYNGNRSRLPYCVMTKSRRLHNAYDVERGRAGHCPTKERFSIDHIYMTKYKIKLNRHYKLINDLTKDASDHKPVIVNVTLLD